MFGFRVIVVGLAILGARPISAQNGPDVPFATILMVRFDSLRQDTLIAQRTHANTALELLGAVKPDALGRISDEQLLRFGRLFGRSLGAAKVETCADMHRKGIAAGFVALAMEMDSALALGWADFMEDMVWASVLDRPIGPRVSAAEVTAAYRVLAEQLTPDKQRSFRRGYDKTGSAEDICYFARIAFGELALAPKANAAAVLRAAMFGSVP